VAALAPGGRGQLFRLRHRRPAPRRPAFVPQHGV